MHIKRVILIYFFLFIIVIAINPTVSSVYSQSQEDIVQYITDLSKDIYNSIPKPDSSLIYGSKGEVKLKLFLSPWGELKDVYVSEPSGNRELDNLCLKTIWLYKRYQPFPEVLGNKDLWIYVPIIFEAENEETSVKGKGWMVKDEAKTRPTVTNLGINDAVDIALENHMAAKIAQEEIELSKLKIREARRSLYPAATLNYLETTGKTAGITKDFTDKEYKLKVEYPLYYGWRLKYAV